MARVTVHLFATLREAAGAAQLELDAENLARLIEELRRIHGGRLRELLSEFPADSERFVVLVNGQNVAGQNPVGVRLRDRDEVSLFPPVSGG
jgi:MoaD family protein